MPLNLPPQGMIDRRVRYEPFLMAIEIIDPQTGKLLEVILEEAGGGFGPLPGDPSPLLRLDARGWNCQQLPGSYGSHCVWLGVL